MRQFILRLTVLLSVFGTLGVAVGQEIVLTDILSRTLLDQSRSAEFLDEFGAAEFFFYRRDRFTNVSTEWIITIDDIQLMSLNPEDVGYEDIWGPIPHTNVYEVQDAAAALHPDVHYWAAQWWNNLDPLPVEWIWSFPNYDPSILAPGESMVVWSERVGQADRDPDDPLALYAELVTGFTVTASITPVPEPSTLILLSMGAIGLLAWPWRRKRV